MAWNPDADSHVTSLLRSESDGKLYVGGDFKNMGVLAAKMLAGNYLKIPKKLVLRAFVGAAKCYCSWYFFSRYMKA
jgi:ABC-type sugar transport system substrate-binding protein